MRRSQRRAGISEENEWSNSHCTKTLSFIYVTRHWFCGNIFILFTFSLVLNAEGCSITKISSTPAGACELTPDLMPTARILIISQLLLPACPGVIRTEMCVSRLMIPPLTSPPPYFKVKIKSLCPHFDLKTILPHKHTVCSHVALRRVPNKLLYSRLCPPGWWLVFLLVGVAAGGGLMTHRLWLILLKSSSLFSSHHQFVSSPEVMQHWLEVSCCSCFFISRLNWNCLNSYRFQKDRQQKSIEGLLLTIFATTTSLLFVLCFNLNCIVVPFM